MHTLYVVAVGLAGAAVGAAVDPLGQRLAGLSRAADDRRRAEREARRAEQAAGDGTGVAAATDVATAAPDPVEPPVASDVTVGHAADAAADAGDTGDVPAPIRHLLASGHSTSRTGGAAVVTGLLWAAAAAHFGEHVLVTPFLVFLALGVVVSVTDLTHRVIPRKLLYGGLVLIVPLQVIVSAVDGTWHSLLLAVVGGVAAYAALFLIWFFAPYFFKGNAMGFGDVDLSGVIGLTVGYLGLVHVYLAFLSGFVIGLVFGLVFMAVAGTGRRTYFPFGPSLCAGAVVAMFWGGTLAEHLFHTSS